jgi:hypothetical protein
MENHSSYFYITFGPFSEVRTHKQAINQTNYLCLQDSSLRERELHTAEMYIAHKNLLLPRS